MFFYYKHVYIFVLYKRQTMKDSKPTNKKQNYNDEVLIILESSFGYSIDYIRKCLRGDRTGIMPDKIIAEYKKLDTAAKKAIQEAAKTL